MKVSSTSLRLKEYMAEHKLKQTDILAKCRPYAQKYGIRIGKSDLSQYVSGKTEPMQDRVFLLARALGKSEAWIMGYDVPEVQKEKQIPLVGQIACGSPILAEENIEIYIPVPADAKVDFALRAKGDSMINARICDGDIVYIRQQPTVENGEIAAVLINKEEATLKRLYYYHDKGLLILKPENPDYEDMLFSKKELNSVEIIGKAIMFLSEI